MHPSISLRSKWRSIAVALVTVGILTVLTASVALAQGHVANDGQTLETQSPEVQQLYTSVWGDNAAMQWAADHNAAIGQVAPQAQHPRYDDVFHVAIHAEHGHGTRRPDHGRRDRPRDHRPVYGRHGHGRALRLRGASAAAQGRAVQFVLEHEQRAEYADVRLDFDGFRAGATDHPELRGGTDSVVDAAEFPRMPMLTGTRW